MIKNITLFTQLGEFNGSIERTNASCMWEIYEASPILFICQKQYNSSELISGDACLNGTGKYRISRILLK